MKGLISPRTNYNSVECLAQLIVRIRPIIEKATRKIEKGSNDQILNVITDLRTQMEDGVPDINGDPLNQEICPKLGRQYSLFSAFELLAYKASVALNDNIVPGFMPYFYLHMNDSVLPYFKVMLNETQTVDQILCENMRKANQKFKDFGDVTLPSQLVFVKIERPHNNQKMEAKLHELLDLTEFGGQKYQIFAIFKTKAPGRDSSVIMSIKDKKGWLTVDDKEISPHPNFILSKESRSDATPTIFVGYIQGHSNIDMFRPGSLAKESTVRASMLIAERGLGQKEAEEVLDDPRPLAVKIFNPAKMEFHQMPEVSFQSKAEFKTQVKGLRNNLEAKGEKSAVVYYKEFGEDKYHELPIEVPPENAEILGDMTGCVEFVNDFIDVKPIETTLTCLTKPDMFSINVQFVSHQKIADMREYVNRNLATALLLPQKNRYIYFWDGDSYQIADDEMLISSFEKLEFYYTSDGRPPNGSHILRVRFVDISPSYHASDAQFSYNRVQTMDQFRAFAQKKFMFHDIDFFTFQETGPRLYQFPQVAAKTPAGKKLSPMSVFSDVQSPLFAQCALPMKEDTAILNFVIAEEVTTLKLTNDAFRLDFSLFTPWKEIQKRMFKVLNVSNADVIYVINQGDKVPLKDKMPAKDLTKGVFFVKLL